VHEDPQRWPTGRLLSAAARKVERRWDAYLEQWSLTHASMPVLAILARQDHSQRELAAGLDVTEQTVSRMVVRLEQTGYLHRRPHPEDRRRHVVTITDAGRAVLADITNPEVVERFATGGMTPAEIETLRTGLLAVLADRAGPQAGP
jgi:DNA-binding MarR family transcriptional regulator